MESAAGECTYENIQSLRADGTAFLYALATIDLFRVLITLSPRRRRRHESRNRETGGKMRAGCKHDSFACSDDC